VEYQAVIGLEFTPSWKPYPRCSVPARWLTPPCGGEHCRLPGVAGMPGVLPVVNQRAVNTPCAWRLALDAKSPGQHLCPQKLLLSRLPKGYQISQYEQATSARRIPGYLHLARRASYPYPPRPLEEDTGKLTHVSQDGESYSLVDLNRAGIPAVGDRQRARFALP